MATTTRRTKTSAKTSRYNELKQMLEDRRRALMTEVQGRIRDVRADGNKDREVLDQGESSEVDIQEDIEFALIQMKSETLNKINEALRRLDEGTYGNCFECGDEIAEARLRALPFAVRCKDCEEARETAEQRERMLAQRAGRPARCSSTCRTDRRLPHAGGRVRRGGRARPLRPPPFETFPGRPSGRPFCLGPDERSS
jgi:DnaK suppressor protein